ncbi:MAG TPA: hypothetical protein VJ963_15005, partial [Bacteroidales bacterium]|nr:hypothetical protein [Bacteroidales bacterium]
HRGVVLISILISGSLLIAQSDSIMHFQLKRNAIYLSGDITSAMGASSIGYERNILNTEHPIPAMQYWNSFLNWEILVN